MSFLILGAMVAAVLAVSLFRYGRNQFADRGVCSAEFKPPRNAALRAALSHNISVESGQLECYFSENYVNARDQFRHLAERAGASMKVMPVVNDLTTDVAIFPGRSDRYVVHISGTHGVEAYSGSAVQAALLEYITENNLYGDVVASAQLPTLVVVHALNPFGFANNRRVNEDNVDLNRNFLSDDEFHFVKSRNPNYANYVDLDSVLNPTSTLTTNFFLNELIAYLQMAQSIAMHGLMRLKRALVSGNYHFAKGLGFGGFSQTQSARNLIKLVVDDLRIPTEAKEIVMVDVHTGLGPSGVDTLMFHVSDEYFAHKQSAEQPLSMDTVFPTDFDSKGKLVGGIKVEEFQSSPLQPKTSTQKDNVHVAAKDVAAGYELTVGTISGSFCNNYLAPPSRGVQHVCITQEFGTIPSQFVGKNLMQENYAYHWGTPEEKEAYGEQLKRTFFVDTLAWKRNVVVRGLKVFLQAMDLAHFSSAAASNP